MDDGDTERVRTTTTFLIIKAVFITHSVWGYLSQKERGRQAGRQAGGGGRKEGGGAKWKEYDEHV